MPWSEKDMPAPGEITALLTEFREGNLEAANRLMPLIYTELRRIASSHLRRERTGHTLQATALVNEVYVRLVDGQATPWQNRAHFFGIAARSMREILVEYARRRIAAKRGGKDAERVEIDVEARGVSPKIENAIAINEALERLERIDPSQSRLVELRYFAGLNAEETAEVMGVSPKTIQREWRSAKAWLYRELGTRGRG